MEVPRIWRLKAQRYRLEGSLCPVCGQPTFPPRPVCIHHAVQPAADAAPRPLFLSALNHPVDAGLLKGD